MVPLHLNLKVAFSVVTYFYRDQNDGENMYIMISFIMLEISIFV